MGVRQAQLTAEFLVQVSAAAGVPRERGTKLLRHVATRVGEAIVVGNEYGPGTPVDTGNARGHWYVAMGGGDPPHDGSAATSGTGAATAGLEALARAADNIATMQLGDVMSWVNDVPYIEALNNGHSQQAPAGMIDPVVASFELLVQAEGLKLGIVP